MVLLFPRINTLKYLGILSYEERIEIKQSVYEYAHCLKSYKKVYVFYINTENNFSSFFSRITRHGGLASDSHDVNSSAERSKNQSMDAVSKSHY